MPQSAGSGPEGGARSATTGAGQGQFSPDGRWWWNGAQWVAVPSVPTPGVTTQTPRRSRQNVARRLAIVAPALAIVTALVFVLDPEINSRAVFVNLSAALCALLTAWLLVLILVRFIRGRRSRTWAGVMLGLLVFESAASLGLNLYVDTKTASVLGPMQDYFAEIAEAVSLGDSVVARQAPTGVTMDTVAAQAWAARTQLAGLDVPADLAAYQSAIMNWAWTVTTDAHFVTTFHRWQNVPYAPEPFQLVMTTAQANAAVKASLGRIVTLTAFYDRAQAQHNRDGLRYIGARLDAQSYWLEAIYTSTDPAWLNANFRFVEPLDYYQDYSPTDIAPIAAVIHSWPRPRSWPNCRANGFAPCNIQHLQAPLTQWWRAAINPPNTQQAPSPEAASAVKQFEAIPPIDTTGAINLGGAGVGGYGQENVPPPAFAARCQAEGGMIGNPVYDRTASRVPTSEGGWTCRTHNSSCFDLLTYSGSEYRGGQPGCPEYGLKPTPLVKALAVAMPAPATAVPHAPVTQSWDGSYLTAPSTLTCHVSATTSDGTHFETTQSGQLPPTPFTVKGNSIVGSGAPVPINAAGQATQTVPTTGGSATVTITFVHDANGGVHYSGSVVATISTSVAGGKVDEQCSGPVSGSRS